MNPPELTGRVLLFTGGDPIAAIVKWQSRSAYSHAALLIPGTNTVIESFPFRGVRQRTLSVRDWERIHAYEVIGMDAAQWQEALDFATARIGQGYDWRNVFRFLTRIPGRENQRWFCSELVFKAIEVAYRRLLNMSAEYVDPGRLAQSTLLRRDEAYELRMLQFLSEGEE
jgi:hypothetical protein